MENFDQNIAEDEGIGLNLDILETGLINILRYLQFLAFLDEAAHEKRTK
jgi:hypothetical protein